MAIEIGKAGAVAQTAHWPRKLAAVLAAGVGTMLLLMGGGHLYGVIVRAAAEKQPLDYRLVSLLATGGIVAYPGLISVALSRWLWRGRDWAFAMCAANTAALLLYVLLLLAARTNPDNVGSELSLTFWIVGGYLVALISLWLSHRSVYAGRS